MFGVRCTVGRLQLAADLVSGVAEHLPVVDIQHAWCAPRWKMKRSIVRYYEQLRSAAPPRRPPHRGLAASPRPEQRRPDVRFLAQPIPTNSNW
eukprot:2519550-Pyramimonas_sp.AAC.1